MKPKYCQRSHRALDDGQIKQMENAVGALPNSYLEHMKDENGGIVRLKSGGDLLLFCFADHSNSILSNYRLDDSDGCKRWLTVGENVDHPSIKLKVNLSSGAFKVTEK